MHPQPAARETAPATYSVPAARKAPEARQSAAEARLRLHTDDHEAPPARRLLTFTLWAAISIFIGIVPASRLIIVLALRAGGWWFPITTVSLGLLGVGLIASAFASIHRAHLPWYLMTIATLLLTTNVTMAYAVP